MFEQNITPMIITEHPLKPVVFHGGEGCAPRRLCGRMAVGGGRNGDPPIDCIFRFPCPIFPCLVPILAENRWRQNFDAAPPCHPLLNSVAAII